jgi:predicted Zn-dependent protease
MRFIQSKLFFLIIGFTCCFNFSNAQDYKEIWSLINNNQRAKATSIIESKLKNNTASIDEFITYNFLQTFDGKEDNIKNFWSQVSKSDNPDAYVYALWFTAPVIGGYGKKEPHQLALLNHLITSSTVNGTLKAASHYSMGHHYVGSHQFPLIKKENEKIGALSNWQFVGPFNNVSGSGFNKNYGPVQDTSNATVFSSTTNAPIKWFTPIEKSTEGWILTENFISDNSGSITFAQTFVNSPIDQEVNLCTGFSGNIKVWVNDQLLISVSEERVTEIDAYNTKCRLKAGYNRVLVQVGSDYLNTNFIIRLTDSNFAPLTTLTSVDVPQKYTKVGGESLADNIPIFAETYFIEKIKKDPENIINYMLLHKTYIRNKKVFEARKNIEKALTIAPNNSLLKFELSLCYLQEKNRTKLSETYEYFKQNEKQSLLGYVLRIEELKTQKKYQEVLDTTEQRIKLFGVDESAYEDKIQAYANLELVPQLVDVINEAYKKYPNNDRFVNYVFNIEKSINKDPKKALKILDNYLSKHYNYELNKLLIKEYFSQNNTKKPYQIINEQIEAWPYNPSLRWDLLSEYLGQQRYSEAYDVCKVMLKMKPYSGYYYQDLARIEEALSKYDEAIASYQKAFIYQPTLYTSRDKQRKLQNKKSLFELAPQDDIDELINKTGKNINTEDFDYYYIKEEQNVVMYPEGGREEKFITVIKILNQRGIDAYKETYISYNENSETLVIEDAQLIKANGKRMKPEISDNQIVWTGLEANDIISIKYKKKFYLKGKFAHEFYDKYVFGSFVPIENARYTIVIPNNKTFNHEVINGTITPTITESENYKVYVWETSILNAIKEETFMPNAADFSPTLHISTINDWNEIAQWYSDIVYSKIASDNDYEVLDVYNQLFEGKANLSADEKARIIYNYISKNINYSSVSFRQSSITPQKASTTINTHLGDCKDLSTLFVSLANLCQLKANLVLVSTRDNGKKDMHLPSFLFNHCIVKFFDESNVEHYLELTDRDLPFKSLPNSLFQALSLTIPSKNESGSKYSLAPINTVNKTRDKIFTKEKIEISGTEMNITYTNCRYGSLSMQFRSSFRSMSNENIKKEMQTSISKDFSTPIKIKNVSFKALDDFYDSVSVTVDMVVSNNVKKMGAQSAFTIPFTDIIISAAPFNLEKRNYDFEYWSYEYADEYETQIEIVLPDEKVFLEIPQNENLSFNDITYSIVYNKVAPNKLLVTRKANINRNNITPEEYEKFKQFISKVIDKEGSYLTFK